MIVGQVILDLIRSSVIDFSKRAQKSIRIFHTLFNPALDIFTFKIGVEERCLPIDRVKQVKFRTDRVDVLDHLDIVFFLLVDVFGARLVRIARGDQEMCEVCS